MNIISYLSLMENKTKSSYLEYLFIYFKFRADSINSVTFKMLILIPSMFTFPISFLFRVRLSVWSSNLLSVLYFKRKKVYIYHTFICIKIDFSSLILFMYLENYLKNMSLRYYISNFWKYKCIPVLSLLTPMYYSYFITWIYCWI